MKSIISTAASLGALMLASACATAPEIAIDPVAVDAEFPRSLVELNFESHGDRLNGHAYLAEGEGPHPTVVLLHGFPGNERNLDLAQDLRSDGFNVLFFHYRGAWGSQGTYSFTHVIEDVASATDYLRANTETYRTDPNKLILIGHSMGGFAALEAAARDERVTCVAGIAPADLGAIANAFDADPASAEGFSAYADTMQMLSGLTGQNAIAEILANREAFDTRLLASELVGKSVLVIGGDKDTSVPPDTIIAPLVAAYEAEPGIDLTAKVLSGDHSFSWSRQELIDTVLDWAGDCR
ncbi:alpha/beta hydrolase family protein [Hyphomonas sp.]|uniref:alpha/beta hydrolase family protein n=1 Tax=Hyphomonas sp. TaxID=87 RepID=UPI0035692AC5